MIANNPYNQYVENQVTTATPGKLLVMAFDAAIRFARVAAEKMQEHKLDEQNANIRRVQNILLELVSSLDARTDPQLAANLQSIYTYMFDRLTHANIRDDAAALEEVTEMLMELRNTWAEAELLVRSGVFSKAA
jgi:flagellar protein FliS